MVLKVASALCLGLPLPSLLHELLEPVGHLQAPLDQKGRAVTTNGISRLGTEAVQVDPFEAEEQGQHLGRFKAMPGKTGRKFRYLAFYGKPSVPKM